MTRQTWITFLLGAVEFALILPGLTGIIILVLQWWGQRVWRYLAVDDYLNAMLYPFAGAAAGTLTAVGLASGLASNGQKGLGWVVAGMAVVVIASVGPALMRRSQAGVPQRFSPNDLELEIKILAGRLYLSAAERQFFERRAAEDELEAQRIIKQADRLTWTRYWCTRSRCKRFLALGSLAPGACLAGVLAWLSGNPLLLVALPSGAGFLIALEASRRCRRRDARFRGSLLMEAAAEIDEYLERLETAPTLEAASKQSFLRYFAFWPRGRRHG